MRILLIVSIWRISVGTAAEITVTGSNRRSVQIRCPYGEGYEDYVKYLCRDDCSEIVRSDSSPEDRRFSLNDYRIDRVFIITITHLRPSDAGTYWCGIERTFKDIYIEVLLQVRTARTAGKIKVTGYVGRRVEIQCPYKAGQEGNVKYLCRGDCANEDILKSSNQRFSLSDNKRSKVFIVTISDLRPEDSKTYWCVVEEALHEFHTEVLVQVEAVRPITTTLPPSTPTTLTGTSAPPRSTSGTTVIVIPVVTVLLLTGLVSFIVPCTRLKKRGREAQMSKKGFKVDENYENVQRKDDESDSIYQNL